MSAGLCWFPFSSPAATLAGLEHHQNHQDQRVDAWDCGTELILPGVQRAQRTSSVQAQAPFPQGELSKNSFFIVPVLCQSLNNASWFRLPSFPFRCDFVRCQCNGFTKLTWAAAVAATTTTITTTTTTSTVEAIATTATTTKTKTTATTTTSEATATTTTTLAAAATTLASAAAAATTTTS